MNKVEFFFQNPKEFNESQGVYSTLFLLRRDILTCFGVNPNDNSKLEYRSILPGIIAIMAGIDLLSKFHFTDKENIGNKSGDRFKNFVSKYIDNENKEVLYQLRNSLLHSFGLYSKDKHGKEYNFILEFFRDQLIFKVDEINYIISIKELHKKFEDSIHKYMNDIINDDILKENFDHMYHKYGVIGIAK